MQYALEQYLGGTKYIIYPCMVNVSPINLKRAKAFIIYARAKTVMDWFQTTLYTRVIVNATRQMKKSPILRCTFFHQYLDFKRICSLHPSPFQKCSGLKKSYVDYFISNVHHRFVIFFVWFQPKIYIYLFVELSFLASSWYTPK